MLLNQRYKIGNYAFDGFVYKLICTHIFIEYTKIQGYKKYKSTSQPVNIISHLIILTYQKKKATCLAWMKYFFSIVVVTKKFKHRLYEYCYLCRWNRAIEVMHHIDSHRQHILQFSLAKQI